MTKSKNIIAARGIIEPEVNKFSMIVMEAMFLLLLDTLAFTSVNTERL